MNHKKPNAMKKLFVIITILLNVNMHALAYDFQSENLLYTILSSNPPTVRLDGHLYGHGVYGDLIIPEEVTFEDVTYKVIAIRNDAFYEYNHLTKISIPSSIQEIGLTAFAYCSSVKELYYNAKNCPDIEYNFNFPFYECTGHLIIGDSVDRVPMNMFRQSFIDQLTIIGNSNTVIGECAFLYCNKLSRKLSLGKVAHIEAGAFWIGASNITSITIDREQPPTVGVYAFHSINKTIPVNVPCGSIELYQNAEQWDEFTNFIEEATILYTDFEPDLYKYITWSENPNSGMDSLDVDLDQDGLVDLWFSGYVQHGALLLTTDVAEGWEYCRPYPEVNTLLDADTLQWRQTTDDWFGTGTFMGRIGLRRKVGNQYYYGWMKVYCDTVPTQPYPGAIGRNTYIDRMAYCTIPDYPLRWGQTCLYGICLEGTEWYYEIQNDDGSITYQHLEYAADTTIGNERPKIIIRSNTHYDRDIWTEVTHEYVYEENGKVYWWNKELEEFTVLYDLAANAGDEWEIKVGTESLTMHVDIVEYFELNGVNVRMLRVSDTEGIFNGDIVCSFGHMTSFFPEKLMNRNADFTVNGLRCYWVEDALLYHNGEDDCDAIHSQLQDLDELIDNAAFVVYPNPANGVLFVETQCVASLPDQTYRITNLMGQTVLQGSITAEKQQINIESLPAGMYFITFAGATQKFVVK